MITRAFDMVLIGAGIVGCTLAQRLSKRFKNILLIEKESRPAEHTSGRNSGVIHSGINPTPGTLKARLCVEGSRLTRAYCRDNQIPCEEVGTHVVALEEADLPHLQRLKEKGDKNGVPGLRILSQTEHRRLEPRSRALASLFSPTGAIVDSALLTRSLAQKAETQGVTLSFKEPVIAVTETSSGVEVRTSKQTYSTGFVVNCAGLQADRIAHYMGVGLEYMIAPFRGEYFVAEPQTPPLVNSMIYPVPHPRFPFLGIHLTRTLSGQVLIGPNAVPALGRESYDKNAFSWKDCLEIVKHPGFRNAFFHNRDLVSLGWTEFRNSCSKKHFLQSAGRLIDGLSQEQLRWSQRVGIRPQLIDSKGDLVDDLRIERTPRSIHVLNVVSPGMTSALAFAQWFSDNLNDQLQWNESPQAAAGVA